MLFSVKYRDNSGALCEKAVEAADRSECFAKCKADGIAPMSVREGGFSSQSARKTTKKSDSGKNHGNGGLRIAACLALGVVVAGGIWCFMGVEERKKETKPKAVKVIKPSVKKVDVSKPYTNNAPVLSKRERQLKQIRDKYGDNIPDNLKPVVYFLENPPAQIFHPARTPEDIFKRSSEREIAAMINTEPGTWFMRKPTFGARFDSDFAESLKEEIKIEETDTPEQRELKQAVIDTKAELATRMKAGAKPSEIMSDFADSLYELGEYRRSIEENLAQLKKDESISDKDIEDFVNTANKMLTEKGAKPIRMPKMVFRHISLKRAAAKRAKEEQESQK